MNSTTAEVAVLSHQCVKYLKGKPGTVYRILLGLLVWLSFVKLPATAIADQPPQSWEAVLSFAVSHHLRWGRDIVFTYGPLGFLTSDYYWGCHFWPILLWSFGFSLLLTILLLRFLERVVLPVRVALYVGLPLLTVPHWVDLGIDPVCLFAITVIGIACLPEEQPGTGLLAVSGSALGLLCLIKFTFCLYCLFALLTISAAHLFRRRWEPVAIVLGCSAASFLSAWLWAGQSISHVRVWFERSVQIASGYSSAMAIAPGDLDLILGSLICLCLIGLLLVHWYGSRFPLARTPGACLLAAGMFLAWKEGFVRADVHVVVFLLYAFFLTATMPALLGASRERQLRFLRLTAATLAFILALFVIEHPAFVTAIRAGVVPKLKDTFTALFIPARFKHRLEAHLESMRRAVPLPQIAAMAGDAPVGVLNSDSDLAILNGLNYRPHPVFHNYCAYTPELQRMNSVFFDSEEAPEYVLWRYGTIGGRFPTLDDGQIVLRILDSYLPVIMEREQVLWRRNPLRGHRYSFTSEEQAKGSIGQWIAIPNNATWLEIELHETLLGSVGKFLFRASMPRIEVRLENGQTLSYHLPPGNALSGFIVNPLLQTEADLGLPFLERGKPTRVTAARVCTNNRLCFEDSFRFVLKQIEGIPALQYEPDAN